MAGPEDVSALWVVVDESSDVLVSGGHMTELEGDDLLKNLHDEQFKASLKSSHRLRWHPSLELSIENPLQLESVLYIDLQSVDDDVLYGFIASL